MSRRRRTKAKPRPLLTRLTAIALTLSLALQLVFAPYHQALAARSLPAPKDAEIAAALKALFGDQAKLCVRADDKRAPAAPTGGCDEPCPFCRFAAEAGALMAPNAPALPARLRAAIRADDRDPAAREAPAPLARPRARAPPAAA